jgi:hypothetical protein
MDISNASNFERFVFDLVGRLNAHENRPTYAHESCPTRCARQHPRMRVWRRMSVRNTLIWQAQGFPLQSRF